MQILNHWTTEEASHFPSCTLWKEVIIYSPHLQNGEVYFPSLRAEFLHIFFLEFCTKDLSLLLHLLLYSIIYLFSYRLMDIYFILWFIIQYYFIFLIKLFQLWPLDVQWFLCSFDISTSFFFFWVLPYLLILQNAPGSSSVILVLVLKSTISPRSPFFLSENHIRNQDLDSRFACFYRSIFTFLHTLSWQSKK